MRPVILSWDNWTPPARTPWGGRAIADRLKATLPIAAEKRAWAAIGESWELSVDPAFPSLAMSGDAAGRPLAELLARDPLGWLGPAAAARGETSTPLLVKLIDAREPLSVQVHPHDDDPALGPEESGKPEVWVVLDAVPGAGVWMGLERGVDRATIEAALDRQADLTPLLRFVPVAPGDELAIPAGTVHAIGPGVTLLEAQLVRPGKSGVTYRFWDWNRGRPLHRERALAVADWTGTERRVDLDGLVVEHVRGHGRLSLPGHGVLQALTALSRLEVAGVVLEPGMTAAIPASLAELTLDLGAAGDAWLARVEDPAGRPARRPGHHRGRVE